MYTVSTNAMDHTDLGIIMFDRLVTVVLKHCRIPERRMQFCGGDTRRLFGPIFDTIEAAQAYMVLTQKISALHQEISVLKEQSAAHTTQPRIEAKYRSNKPDDSNMRAKLEWRRNQNTEVLTKMTV